MNDSLKSRRVDLLTSDDRSRERQPFVGFKTSKRRYLLLLQMHRLSLRLEKYLMYDILHGSPLTSTIRRGCLIERLYLFTITFYSHTKYMFKKDTYCIVQFTNVK